MPLTATQCRTFNDFLFRRVPDWDKELARDRFPWNTLYANLYPKKTWKSFTGTTHTWDKIHVTRPNDDGNWEVMNADACVTAICDPDRLFTGWGSTRNSYHKYHRDYQTPVFCFDQIRHVEEAVAQLDAIVEGHKKMPESIVNDFIRLLAMNTANKLFICGAAGTEIAVTNATFTGGTLINLGGAGNLPTSQLSMNYLDNHIEDLMYNGYFNSEFMPQGKFECTTDIQTLRNIANQNPSLSAMYDAADFVKGGKFYAYGVMAGVGNWLFKIDPEPARYQHIGGGVLQRVWPFENVPTTVGKMPQFSTAYKNARYQMYHVFNHEAREIYVGDTTPVNPEMKFLSRNLMGKWSWKNPDYFRAADPNTGELCEYNNDKKNKGYFLGEYEMTAKTIYPEIEMIILALREPQPVVDDLPCSAEPSEVYQSLLPYNAFCPSVDPLSGIIYTLGEES